MRSSVRWICCRLIIVAVIALFGLSASRPLFAQSPIPPPSTEKIPLNTWLDGKNISQLEWTVRVVPPVLTDYQRYQASIVAHVWLNKVDAADNTAKLLAVARFTNSEGKSFDAGNTYPLPRRTDGQAPEIVATFTAYLLPGEYKVALVVYGTASHKRNVTHRMIVVPRISKDPLPNAWNNLASVEFLRMRAPFGVADGHLNLPLQSSQPVRVEVIANVTPSYALKPYPVIYRRNRNAMFPELDVLSQIKAPNGTLDLIALELDDQKVAFEQNGLGTLDAPSLWKSLSSHITQITSVVNASAIAGEDAEANFFVTEVNKRIAALGSSSSSSSERVRTVVIVLSNKMAFPKGEDLAPISATSDCNCRVFYIRTHVMLDPYAMHGMMGSGISSASDTIHGEAASPSPPQSATGGPRFPPARTEANTKIPNVDQLEKTLAPLNPRILDVTSITDFRQAIAVILQEAGAS